MDWQLNGRLENNSPNDGELNGQHENNSSKAWIPGMGGGGGNDTPWLRVPAVRIFKSYPVSEWNFQIYTLPRSVTFFRDFFGGSIVMKIFILFSNQFFWEEGQIPGTMYQNTEMSCFQRKP